MPEAVAGWHGGEPPRILPGLELLPGVVRCFGFPVIQQSHLGGCAPALHLRLLSACGYSAAGGLSLPTVFLFLCLSLDCPFYRYDRSNYCKDCK